MLEHFRFDTSSFELRESTADARGWLAPDGVMYRLAGHVGPPQWPFDLTQPEAAHAFFKDMCDRNAGVMLSCDVVAAGGVEALAGVFKYRAPFPGSLAMYYVGILWVPFASYTYQLNVEAFERGTTGLREATISALEPPPPMPPPDQIEIVKDIDALFAKFREAPVRALGADDERHDAMFPEHPLSQVRARLRAILTQLTLTGGVSDFAPFRRDERSAPAA